jgi:hypothetical protein
VCNITNTNNVINNVITHKNHHTSTHQHFNNNQRINTVINAMYRRIEASTQHANASTQSSTHQHINAPTPPLKN